MKIKDWIKWYFGDDKIVEYSLYATPTIVDVKDGSYNIKEVRCYLYIKDKYGRCYNKYLVLWVEGRARLKYIDEELCAFLTEDDFLDCECWDGCIF